MVSWKPPTIGLERPINKWGVFGYIYQITTSAALHGYTLSTTTMSADAATDTFTDTTKGNFLTRHLEIGDTFEIECGACANAGTFEIESLTETTITVTTDDIVNDAAGDAIVMSATSHDGILVDLCTIVPAPRTMHGHKFSQRYQQRAFWGSDVYGMEENALDYTMANTIDVFNGIDSSDRGQRIYVGGPEKLTGTGVVFNRFGSGIFETMLIFKEAETHLLFGTNPEDFRLYQISTNYGCPAPMTIASAEVGYELAQGTYRNVAVWLSYRGPILFDGAVIAPITGVDLYFDPRKDTAINLDYIHKSVGWFDPYWMEYHLLIPSGSGQTTLNVHLVYNLTFKRWYKINYDGGPADMPQFGCLVKDEFGSVYPYVFRDDGHTLRYGYGTDWDGNTLRHVIKTADIIGSGSLWKRSRVLDVTLGHEVPDFSSSDDPIVIRLTHYSDGKNIGIYYLEDWTIQRSDYLGEVGLLEEDEDQLLTEAGANIVYDGTTQPRYLKHKQGMNQSALSHQFKFVRNSTAASYLGNFGKRFLFWGMRVEITGDDLR